MTVFTYFLAILLLVAGVLCLIDSIRLALWLHRSGEPRRRLANGNRLSVFPSPVSLGILSGLVAILFGACGIVYCAWWAVAVGILTTLGIRIIRRRTIKGNFCIKNLLKSRQNEVRQDRMSRIAAQPGALATNCMHCGTMVVFSPGQVNRVRLATGDLSLMLGGQKCPKCGANCRLYKEEWTNEVRVQW